jgi:hypothetical protein
MPDGSLEDLTSIFLPPITLKKIKIGESLYHPQGYLPMLLCVGPIGRGAMELCNRIPETLR